MYAETSNSHPCRYPDSVFWSTLPPKIHRFIIFAMYCFITTVPQHRSLIPHRPTGHTGASGRDLILHRQPVEY